jgi:chitin disaccharide deacetylase
MTIAHTRRLAVCVDDFGIHAPSDAAILDLADAQKISAISVLVNGHDVQAHLVRLRDIQHHLPSCAVGLHFNLTERFDAEQWCMPLKSLIIRSQSRNLDHDLITQAIVRQLDAFEALYQAPPDYIDGHEHVHAFPVIRALLLAQLQRRYAHVPALRVPASAGWQGLKALIIASLGGFGLKRQLTGRQGSAMNRDFLGVYDFSVSKPYAQRVQHWLASAKDQALLMTHPGLHDDTVYGAAARHAELTFLQSKQWLEALQTQNITLVPFKRSHF